MSSGTTIKYVDLYKGSNVSSYSRLIGVLLTSSPDSKYGFAVVVCAVNLSPTLGVWFYSGLSITADSNYKIRVFYY